MAELGRLPSAVRRPLAITGAISNGGLRKEGAASLDLNASNVFAGDLTIADGELNISNNNALGSTTGITRIELGATLGVGLSCDMLAKEKIYLANGTLRMRGPSSGVKYYTVPGSVYVGGSTSKIMLDRRTRTTMSALGAIDTDTSARRDLKVKGFNTSRLDYRRITTRGKVNVIAQGNMYINGQQQNAVIIPGGDDPTDSGTISLIAEKPDPLDPDFAGADPLDFGMPVLQATMHGQLAADVNTGTASDYGVTVDSDVYNVWFSEPVTGGGMLSKVGTGSLTVPNFRTGTLDVQQGMIAVAPYTGALPSNRVKSVVFSTPATPTAKLDLSNNDLIIDYTGTSPAATVRSLLISGRNGGTWDGNGIATSLSTVSTDTHKRAMGYADTAVFALTSFDEKIGDSSIVIKYTFAGDCTLDGLVDFNDLVPLAQNYGLSGKEWIDGDMTYDGVVDFNDLVAQAQNYNWTGALRRGGEGDDGAYDVFLELQAGAPWILEDALAHPEGYALFSPYLNGGEDGDGIAGRSTLGMTRLQNYAIPNNFVPEPTTLMLTASSLGVLRRRRR